MPIKKINRRDAVKGLLVGAGAAPLLLGPARALAESPVRTLSLPSRRARILAVTDLHFFCKTAVHDQRTIRLIGRLIDHFEPDLLVADGDIWHNNPMGQGERFCEFACRELGAMGVPWAFVRGNHDLADDFIRCEEMLARAPHSLYPSEPCDANYRIDLAGPEGDVFRRLFILNDARPELGFGEDEAQRLEQISAAARAARNGDAPCFMFCHIPIRSFESIVRDGQAHGVMREKVCHEDGLAGAIDAVSGSGLIDALFCGHDHVNNYWGVASGVHLEYVRATGYGGYGNSLVKKGATLIEAGEGVEAGFESITVFGNGETWKPDGYPVLIEK